MRKEALERQYDHYLLVDPRGIEQHYKPDYQRPMPELKQRVAFFEYWKKMLDDENKPYTVVSGQDWDARLNCAVRGVENAVPALKKR